MENERVIALGLARRVPRLGYTVAALATSAHETVTQVDACLSDLMFMDIRLPKPIEEQTLRETMARVLSPLPPTLR